MVIKWLKTIEWHDGHVFRPVKITRKGPDVGERYHDSGRQYGGQIKSGLVCRMQKGRIAWTYASLDSKGIDKGKDRLCS